MSTVLTFDGHTPQIDPDAWLAPSATVIGQATIAADASVFYGAVVRADTATITIGAAPTCRTTSWSTPTPATRRSSATT